MYEMSLLLLLYRWSAHSNELRYHGMRMVGPDTFDSLGARDDPCLAFRLTIGLQPPDLIRRYWKGVLWSPSYFAASRGGAPINILKTYIEQQKTPL